MIKQFQIGLAGIALVVSGQIGAHGEDRRFLFGVLMCLSAALSYATYLVAGSELTRRIGSMRFTAYTMIAATLPAAVQFFALEPLSALDLSARSSSTRAASKVHASPPLPAWLAGTTSGGSASAC